MPRSIYRACLGEIVGTFLLVLFGTGAVASAVLTGALAGLWQVAVVWGFGVTLAIYATAAASGAHLNPAVTLSMAIFRAAAFPVRRVLPYWGAQLLGAVLAGACSLTTTTSAGCVSSCATTGTTSCTGACIKSVVVVASALQRSVPQPAATGMGVTNDSTSPLRIVGLALAAGWLVGLGAYAVRRRHA